MKKYNNEAKNIFLSEIPTCSLETDTDCLSEKCKFNFAYFDVQPAGQDFCDWSTDQQTKLFEKLKYFTKETLEHWRRAPIGASGSVLATYGKFPTTSDFKHPRHVPHEVEWGRFRLEQAIRLIGFTLPNRLHGTIQRTTGHAFDCNTFYVVVLDANHRFYKTEKR